MTEERKDAAIGLTGKGGGESEGGAYPNPYTGKKGKDTNGFMGHGGQTEQAYFGGEQLGEDVLDEDANPNSASRSDKDGQRDK